MKITLCEIMMQVVFTIPCVLLHLFTCFICCFHEVDVIGAITLQLCVMLDYTWEKVRLYTSERRNKVHARSLSSWWVGLNDYHALCFWKTNVRDGELPVAVFASLRAVRALCSGEPGHTDLS